MTSTDYTGQSVNAGNYKYVSNASFILLLQTESDLDLQGSTDSIFLESSSAKTVNYTGQSTGKTDFTIQSTGKTDFTKQDTNATGYS